MRPAIESLTIYLLNWQLARWPLAPTVPEIIQKVARAHGTTVEALASPSRRREVRHPRQLAMYFCDRYAGATVPDIGRALNRHHPSVSNGIRKIAERLGT